MKLSDLKPGDAVLYCFVKDDRYNFVVKNVVQVYKVTEKHIIIKEMYVDDTLFDKTTGKEILPFGPGSWLEVTSQQVIDKLVEDDLRQYFYRNIRRMSFSTISIEKLQKIYHIIEY